MEFLLAIIAKRRKDFIHGWTQFISCTKWLNKRMIVFWHRQWNFSPIFYLSNIGCKISEDIFQNWKVCFVKTTACKFLFENSNN